MNKIKRFRAAKPSFREAVPIFPVRRLHKDAELPMRMTRGAAAFDVRAMMDQPSEPRVVAANGGTLVVSTGMAFAIPFGWCIKALSRSGHGFKFDVSLSNSVGLIDSDYRGELMLKLRNDGPVDLVVKHRDRVAQLLCERVEPVLFEWALELPSTERGLDGLGSTGVE